MDKKAIYSLSYGIFMLSTKLGDKANGCIINTCIQVANNPTRVAISVLNTNYTCDLLKKSGVFALSVLDEQCTFDSIKHFGFQSGRDVDKFEGIKMSEDVNGIPYMGWYVCAVISGKVVDAKMLSDKAPLTYADYQAHVKPKADKPPKTDKKVVGWRCKICNYVYEGSELPADYVCPLCGHGADDFEPIYE